MAEIFQKPIATIRNDSFVIVGASSVHEAIDDDPGPPAVPDDGTTQVHQFGGNTFMCAIEPIPPALTVSSITVTQRGFDDAGGGGPGWRTMYQRLADALPQALATHTGGSWLSHTETIPAPGGGWTREEANGLLIGFEALTGDATRKRSTMLHTKTTYTPAPIKVEQHRLVASQVLLSRLKQLFVKMSLPLNFLDLDLLEQFPFSHPLFPSVDGKGIGEKRWQRLLLLSLSANIDPMNNRINVEGFRTKDYTVTYFDVGQSKISTSKTSEIADGIAIINTGGTRQFTRGSRAYGLDPSGLIYVEYAIDEEARVRDGMLLERSSITRIWNSAFKDGFTNWTKVGDGVGGSSITLDQDNAVFAKSPIIQTPQCVKLVTGTGSLVSVDHQTNFSFGASSKLTVSVLHHNEESARTALRVQNITTGNWLKTDGTWGATEVNAIFPPTRVTATREFFTFTLEATASQLKIRVLGSPAGNTVSYAHHVQIETAPGSSIIVSGSADETRAISMLKLSNNFGSRIFHGPHGFISFEFLPNFDDSDDTINKVFLAVDIDGSNFDRFFYDQGVGWTHQRIVGGSGNNAINGTLAQRGVLQKVVFRWTNDEGQLGLPAHTRSVFVDGVKGTDVGTITAPIPLDTMDAWIGSIAGTNSSLDGIVRNLKFGAYVPTDVEVKRLL